jgi:hypothetical protein
MRPSWFSGSQRWHRRLHSRSLPLDLRFGKTGDEVDCESLSASPFEYSEPLSELDERPPAEGIKG